MTPRFSNQDPGRTYWNALLCLCLVLLELNGSAQTSPPTFTNCEPTRRYLDTDTAYVTTLVDSGPGSLRQAILDANNAGGGSVRFSNVTGAIVLLSALPEFKANIEIVCTKASRVCLTGSNLVNGIQIASGSTSSIQGLVFSNFLAVHYGNGAAISNGGSLRLLNCSFLNNSTLGFGGAIYNSGNLEADRCRFLGNSARGEDGERHVGVGSGGGGAGLGGALFSSSGRLSLSDCSLALNAAIGGNGGGIAGSNHVTMGGRGGGPFGGFGGSISGDTNGSPGGFGSGGGGGVWAGGPICGSGGSGGFGGGGGAGIDAPIGAVFSCASGSAGKFAGQGNGRAGSGGAGIGGAIFVDSGDLLMNSCILATNMVVGGNWGASAVGGAIFLRSGTAQFTNCSVLGNESRASNGGVYSDGHFGLPAGDTLGAGLYLSSGVMSVYGCSVVANRGYAGSGGDGTRYGGSAGLSRGGGIYCERGNLRLWNSTISQNRVEAGDTEGNLFDFFGKLGGNSEGAGIYVETGQATLDNVTVAENQAIGGRGAEALVPGDYRGAGLGGGLANRNGRVVLRGTLVAGNTAQFSKSYQDVWGSFLSSARNLIGETNGSAGWSASDLLNINPQLGPLRENGGPGLTHPLLAGSPAIDAGTNNGLALDGRGQPRTIDDPAVSNTAQSDGTDIGALEVNHLLTGTEARKVSNDILVMFTTVSDKTYGVEYRSEMGGSSWIELPGGVFGTGGIATYTNTDAAFLPRRFYRMFERLP